MSYPVTIAFELEASITETVHYEWPDELPPPLVGDYMTVPIRNRSRYGKIVCRSWSFLEQNFPTLTLLVYLEEDASTEPSP
jgi:hypothetical protein